VEFHLDLSDALSFSPGFSLGKWLSEESETVLTV